MTLPLRPARSTAPEFAESVSPIEPLLSLNELVAILGCSRRHGERMRSSGRLPKPTLHVGRCPILAQSVLTITIKRNGCISTEVFGAANEASDRDLEELPGMLDEMVESIVSDQHKERP